MNIFEKQVDVPNLDHPNIPCSIWAATESPRGVVLIGHGLGVDRFHGTVVRPLEILVKEYRAAVVVPEIPLHGVRAELPFDTPEIVDRWQRFWVSGGAELICRELQRLTSFCGAYFDDLPVAYYGVSLGTQYGIPFLALARNIKSAVLGLFGSRPPPKTPVMNRFAPAVRCPIYFIQKLDDEIHPAETSTHLFYILGPSEKVLDTTRGRHGEVSEKTMRSACEFLVRQGRFRDP